jgi:hypothetical protein
MHVLFFTSNKKAVQTGYHNYIYIILLISECFRFCAKALSENKTTQSKTTAIQSLRLIHFQIAQITILKELRLYKPYLYNSPECILKY